MYGAFKGSEMTNWERELYELIKEENLKKELARSRWRVSFWIFGSLILPGVLLAMVGGDEVAPWFLLFGILGTFISAVGYFSKEF
jgi:hypothetical protein